MPTKQLNVFEKISHNLFKSTSEAEHVLTPSELEIKKRYMLFVAKMLEFPQIPDTTMVTYIMQVTSSLPDADAGISRAQAYRDLANVKVIVSNIHNASKSWSRYMVIEGLKKSYIRAIEKKNLIAEIAALSAIGKFEKLDKEDMDKIHWEDYIPPDFELSNDVRVLDEKLYDPDIEEKREKLRNRYNKAIDTDFEHVK